MNIISDIGVWGVRVVTGLILFWIGLQPITVHHAAPLIETFPLTLSATNMFFMDVMLRLAFLVFGLAIVLGVRTRVSASIMLVLTMAQAVQCIHTHSEWTIGKVFVSLAIVGLCVLVVQGGRRFSVLRGGWQPLQLKT